MAAAKLLEELYTTLVPPLERVLTGACLTEGYKDWTLTRSVSSFAASWRKDGIRANIDLYLTIPVIQHWSELTPLFDALSLKCSVDADTWESTDDAESYSRRYKGFAAHADDRSVAVHITASLPGDTDTCKRVIVGYRDAIQAEALPAAPIYELRCEE